MDRLDFDLSCYRKCFDEPQGLKLREKRSPFKFIFDGHPSRAIANWTIPLFHLNKSGFFQGMDG